MMYAQMIAGFIGVDRQFLSQHHSISHLIEVHNPDLCMHASFDTNVESLSSHVAVGWSTCGLLSSPQCLRRVEEGVMSGCQGVSGDVEANRAKVDGKKEKLF